MTTMTVCTVATAISARLEARFAEELASVEDATLVRRCADVTDAELVALVGDRLASYKRPSRVVFVEQIPRLPSGKVLRRVLKEQLTGSPVTNGVR